MKRKRGERNWEDCDTGYILHQPQSTQHDLEQQQQVPGSDVIYVYGSPYIRAVDGKLEPVP